jgi:hypothetical protein
MEKIIESIDKDLLSAELTQERLLRPTNKGNNEIYVIDGRECPNVMREIGRLREIAFRDGGGGTGKNCDIDEFDIMNPPCQQLIVWDPKDREILGGYRFILGENVQRDDKGRLRIATSHMFGFSDRFITELLPHTLELGRSFVRLEYQSSKAGAKALYALDNLWDGLGALTVIYPQIKYLFGKVTMYPSYGKESRNLVLYFVNKYFYDHEHLVWPLEPLNTEMDIPYLESLFIGKEFKEDLKILHRALREQGSFIPPLINAYMNLSPTMRMFGTAINREFGDVEESGIFITLNDIFEEKKIRHIGSFKG